MINLNSTDERIRKEVMEELPKVIYWYQKKSRDPKFNEGLSKIHDECERKHTDIIGESVEYTSKSGNKWRMITFAKWYEIEKRIVLISEPFMYYNTIGSFGIFCPFEDHIIIFTSHFFQRMMERLNIQDRDNNLMNKFAALVSNINLHIHPSASKKEKRTVDVSLSEGVGRGIVRSEEHKVIEIRTYLKNTDLTYKQKSQTKKVRDADDGSMPFSLYCKIKGLDGDDCSNMIKQAARDMTDDPFLIDFTARMATLSLRVLAEYGLRIEDFVFDNLTARCLESAKRFMAFTYDYDDVYELMLLSKEISKCKIDNDKLLVTIPLKNKTEKKYNVFTIDEDLREYSAKINYLMATKS